MKGTLLFISLLLLRAAAVSGQADLQDYLQMVAGFTENKQHLEAVKLCDKLLNAYPENPDIYFLRGINRYVLKDYEAAISDFDKTLALYPGYPDVFLYRAKARKANKDYLGALSDYSKAKDKNFSQTITSLAGDLLRSVVSDH
jgi:tetratricopeptide (TPR) repeat protein